MERTTLYPIKPGCFRPRKDGISIIDIQYCFTSKKKPLLDTGIEIPVKYWDKQHLKISRDIPPEYGSARKAIILERWPGDAYRRHYWGIPEAVAVKSNGDAVIARTYGSDVATSKIAYWSLQCL